MNFLKRALSGEEKLWKVFWIHAVAGLTLVLCTATGGLWLLKYDNNVYAEAMRIIALSIQTAYLLWLAMALWRCAGNTASLFLKKTAKLYDVSIVIVLLWFVCGFMVANFASSIVVKSDFKCDSSDVGNRDVAELSFIRNMCSLRIINRL